MKIQKSENDQHTCPYFHQHTCRSCSLLDLNYSETLNIKQQNLQQLFPYVPISPLIPAPQIFPSRNKAKMAVGGSWQNPRIGLTTGQMQVQDLLHCPLHLPEINRLLTVLQQRLPLYKIHPYDISQKKGELKFIIVHQSPESCELLLRFVVRSKSCVPQLQKLTQHLRDPALFPQLAPQMAVVSVNIQPIHQAILEGPEEILLTEQKFITHQLGPYQVQLPPRSFFQTNSAMALALYQHVQLILQEIRPKHLLDLYCGVGLFSFFAAPYVQEKITAVEISADAIAAAKLSLALNQKQDHHSKIPISFHAQPVEDFFQGLLNNSRQQQKMPSDIDAVIVNPPRGGLTQNVIASLRQLSPQHLIYSSCNPLTLQRDAELLQQDGLYQLQFLRPLDMFPYTHHCEVLAYFLKGH